jgi:hypothetical protein
VLAEIEDILWEEIINIAKGIQTVEAAAVNIVRRTPEFYDHFDVDARQWFMLSALYHYYLQTLIK